MIAKAIELRTHAARNERRAATVLAVVLVLASARPAPCQDGVARPALAGLSNHGQNKHEPYVTAGDRTHLIGTQDGTFPDQGGHVPGEMGGLWLHPIKLIDGFSAMLTDLDSHARDTLAWQPSRRVFVARDTRNPWFCVGAWRVPLEASIIALGRSALAGELGVSQRTEATT